MEQNLKSSVALVSCPDYAPDRVEAAVEEGLALLGQNILPELAGRNVLLKPNFLRHASAERAITTHPAVFRGVARALQKRGCTHIFYGDSPGNPVTDTPARVAEACGIAQAAGELGISQADFEHGRETEFPRGHTCRRFVLCPGAADAELIINLPKMKTHALQRVTGAVKNLYGCVYGLEKGLGHARYSDAASFAGMLADLHLLLKPRLHIMDGIVAMEGNGPAAGKPVKMGVLLFSADPAALDSVMCALMNLDPALVPTSRACEAAGVGRWKPEEIRVLTPLGEMTPGEAAERWGKKDFDVCRDPIQPDRGGTGRRLLRMIQKKPYIRRELCVGCGVCVQSCPVPGKALVPGSRPGQPPHYRYDRCIRCYCCQEMCPREAIAVRTPWVARLLLRKEKQGRFSAEGENRQEAKK